MRTSARTSPPSALEQAEPLDVGRAGAVAKAPAASSTPTGASSTSSGPACRAAPRPRAGARAAGYRRAATSSSLPAPSAARTPSPAKSGRAEDVAQLRDRRAVVRARAGPGLARHSVRSSENLLKRRGWRTRVETVRCAPACGACRHWHAGHLQQGGRHGGGPSVTSRREPARTRSAARSRGARLGAAATDAHTAQARAAARRRRRRHELRLYGRNFHLHAPPTGPARSRRRGIATARTASCSTGRTARSSGTSPPRT